MGQDEQLARLHALVDEICELLGRYGIDGWVRWLRAKEARLRQEGPSGGGRFAAGWGGMGGFMDLYITPVNGHPIDQADVPAVNERLVQLQSELHRAATSLRAGE